MNVLLLLCLILVLQVAVSQIPPTDEKIFNAFSQDNFTVVANATLHGYRGFLANSLNATTLSNGQPKTALYLEGDPYTMGYLSGYLMEYDVGVVCTTFLKNLPAELIDEHIQNLNSTFHEELEQFMKVLLTKESVKIWNREVKHGVIPFWAVDQINGVHDGAKAKNSNTSVTQNALIAVNFALDIITARVFSGNFLGLARTARRYQMPSIEDYFLALARGENTSYGYPLKPPAFCDAIGVRGNWTKTGKGAFFGRDFQFTTAGVLQELITPTIYNPLNSFQVPMISIGAPGFVGSIAGINTYGVSMGIDTIRSSSADAKDVGFNSALLIRQAMGTATNLEQAIEIVSKAARGAPYLYPVCDGSGDCAVLEAGVFLPNGTAEDPLQYVKKHLTDLLPNSTFISNHSDSRNFRNGLYVRYMNYTYPEEYLQFNPGLFEHAQYPYDERAFKLGTYLFHNFTADTDAEPILQNNFFYPQKEDDPDLVLVSNFGIVPEMRITQMSKWSDKFAATGEAMFWRYDKLLTLLYEVRGLIDFETTQWIMSFLSPERTPGYWKNLLNPNDTMSAVVEGSITVYDLENIRVLSKSGYWSDEWVELSLMNYI